MASSSGKASFVEKLEHRVFPQPPYHDDDKCGSSNHGLSSTLEKFAVKNDVAEGLRQITRCIDARKEFMEKQRSPNASHHAAVTLVEGLYNKYLKLAGYNSEQLKTTIVRFYDGPPSFFEIKCLGNSVGGGLTRKNKRRSAKTRRISKRRNLRKN